MREILREVFRDNKTKGGAIIPGTAEASARELADRLGPRVTAANRRKSGSMELEVRQLDKYAHEWAVILWEK